MPKEIVDVDGVDYTTKQRYYYKKDNTYYVQYEIHEEIINLLDNGISDIESANRYVSGKNQKTYIDVISMKNKLLELPGSRIVNKDIAFHEELLGIFNLELIKMKVDPILNDRSNSDKNVTGNAKSDFYVHNELKNAQKIIINQKKIIQSFRTNLRVLRREITDGEIGEIADSCRFKNGKLNFTLFGNKLGITRQSAAKLIKQRNLTYLKKPPQNC